MQECFVLLCWTSVVLQQLTAANAKKAVAKLVECQVEDVAAAPTHVNIFIACTAWLTTFPDTL